MAHPAVFLDRDGTLIEDVGYAARPEQIRILPGAARALVRLARAGYKLVVVTNQSGIARGRLTEADLERFHAALDGQLDVLGARIDAYYACPHHPDATVARRPDLAVECPCRKPKPGMVHQAAEELDLDLGASWLVGDSWRDVQAGQAAGVWTIKLPSPETDSPRRPDGVEPPEAEVADLGAAAAVILGEEPPVEADEGPTAPPETASEPTEAETPTPPPAPGPERAAREAVAQTEAAEAPAEAVKEAQPDAVAEPSADVPEPEPLPERDAEPEPVASSETAPSEPRSFQEEAQTPLPHHPHLAELLSEVRRMTRRQMDAGLSWQRLLAYVLTAAALFCALVLGLTMEPRYLFLQVAALLQLFAVTLLLLERRP